MGWVGTTPDRIHALKLIAGHGQSSLDFFKLWPDKVCAFLDDGTTVVAYRSALGTAVSLGDPVGPTERRLQAVAEFIERMRREGRAVVFVGALPDALPVYRQLGLSTRVVGQEAVVDLGKFVGHTIDLPEVRRYHRSLELSGHQFERCLPPHPAQFVKELEAVNKAWLSLQGRRERGFGLGRFGRVYLGTTPVAALRDPDGRLVAFVNEAPCFRTGGTAIDLMRRRPNAATGAMTYLICCVLTAAHGRGQRELSLGIVPFATLREGSYTLSQRLTHVLLRATDRFFAVGGLQRFKGKFAPGWEPRYLVFQGGIVGLTRAFISLATVMHHRGPDEIDRCEEPGAYVVAKSEDVASEE